MNYNKQKKKHYYTTHNPSCKAQMDNTPLSLESKLILISGRVSSGVPRKPKMEEYKLSLKTFNGYEKHPARADRHRRYDIGCMPVIVFWIIVGIGTMVCSSIDRLDLSIVFPAGIGLGFLGMFVWGFLREAYNKVESYDRYKSSLNRYEEERKRYYDLLRQKDELERIIIDKEKAIRSFVLSTEGTKFIVSYAQKLKNYDVFNYRTEETWRKMTPREFEFEVGDVYARLGYMVSVTKESSDGGIDIVLTKEGHTTYVQCKHYAPTTPVGVHEVREFFGVCMQKHSNGIFVHTSNLTPSAQEFVSSPGVKHIMEIVSLNQLMKLEKKGCAALLDLNTKASYSFTFLKDVVENRMFIDCRYFWLYNQVFETCTAASQAIKGFQVWEEMQYAIVSEVPEPIESPVFMVVLGSKEAIRQLSRSHQVE